MPLVWASAAFGMVMMGVSAAAAQASQPMMTGGLTSQPIGHYEFCKANPAECSIRLRDVGPEHLDDRVWQELADVNTMVNATVKPMNDYDIYGKDEVWAYPQRRRRLRGLCAREAPRPDAARASRFPIC